MNERVDDIRTRLDSIADELADIALEALRAKVSGDESGVDENKITRARRSIVKASDLLR